MHWELFHPKHPDPNQPAQLLSDFPTGLLYGYGAYTTLKLPLSEQLIDLHLQRLKKDCKALGLVWRYTDHWVLGQLKAAFQPANPILRLTVCADIEGYADFYQPEKLPSRLFLSARPAPAPSHEGITLKTVAHQRPMPTIKHSAMAETVLIKRQAQAEGFNDILLINQQGHACESSTANLFLIHEGSLQTPQPDRDGCLPGITSQQILDSAEAQRIPVSHAPVTLEAIQSAQGVFLTNATQGVIRVAQVNGLALPWPTAAQRLAESLAHTVNT